MLRILSTVSVALVVAACSAGTMSMPRSSNGPSSNGPPRSRLGGPPPQPTATAPTKVAKPAFAPDQQELANPGALDLINELRHTKGLPPVSVSPELTRAAQLQAANLARSGTLSHIGPDGSTPLDRVRRAGYRPRMAAESIAGGQANAVEAFRTWRETESHLRNLLLAEAVHIGLGQASDPRDHLRTYWTLVLAAPAAGTQR